MNGGRIFLVGQDKDQWIPMIETPYTQEETLQLALAHYPDLLPGDQINPEAPRRWLLVKRELGVPGDNSNASIWSLDHLFLDQDGIPTFVECKRAADTRSRREVIAQMLDYAANGTEYWSMDHLRQAAAETARHQSLALDEEIQRLIGESDEDGVEGYWQKVEGNLREGRIRLIFVADALPRELRRLIEFLNSKMADVEVLGVEVKQFLGHGQTAMVPRVIGLTEAARTSKPRVPRRSTTRQLFMEQCSAEAASFFGYVLDKAAEKGHTVYWGEKGFSVRVLLPEGHGFASVVYGYPPDLFQFYFSHLDGAIPDTSLAALRKELLDFQIFRESGKKTLSTHVTGEPEGRLRQVYDFILHRVDDLIQAQSYG
jgi:hypothetical protein